MMKWLIDVLYVGISLVAVVVTAISVWPHIPIYRRDQLLGMIKQARTRMRSLVIYWQAEFYQASGQTLRDLYRLKKRVQGMDLAQDGAE